MRAGRAAGKTLNRAGRPERMRSLHGAVPWADTGRQSPRAPPVRSGPQPRGRLESDGLLEWKARWRRNCNG